MGMVARPGRVLIAMVVEGSKIVSKAVTVLGYENWKKLQPRGRVGLW